MICIIVNNLYGFIRAVFKSCCFIKSWRLCDNCRKLFLKQCEGSVDDGIVKHFIILDGLLIAFGKTERFYPGFFSTSTFCFRLVEQLFDFLLFFGVKIPFEIAIEGVKLI